MLFIFSLGFMVVSWIKPLSVFSFSVFCDRLKNPAECVKNTLVMIRLISCVFLFFSPVIRLIQPGLSCGAFLFLSIRGVLGVQKNVFFFMLTFETTFF